MLLLLLLLSCADDDNLHQVEHITGGDFPVADYGGANSNLTPVVMEMKILLLRLGKCG